METTTEEKVEYFVSTSDFDWGKAESAEQAMKNAYVNLLSTEKIFIAKGIGLKASSCPGSCEAKEFQGDFTIDLKQLRPTDYDILQMAYKICEDRGNAMYNSKLCKVIEKMEEDGEE